MRLKVIFALLFTQLIFAQTPNFEEKDLLGNWKITKVEIGDVIKTEEGKTPDLSDTSKSKNLVNALAKSISDAYMHSTFSFKADHKLKIKTKRRKIKGTYSYNKEEGCIITDIPDFKKLYFSKFEKGVFVIGKIDDNDMIKLTYIRK